MMIRKQISNCEIVYSDADLPSADAVVFHLHKVFVLTQQNIYWKHILFPQMV